MIIASDIELRAGARLLLETTSIQVAAGDRIGLVGRNGAGKTTLTRVLAGEGQPAAGGVRNSGTVGYLPQDPRSGDLEVLARDRILSARGIDRVLRNMEAAQEGMGSDDPKIRDAAVAKYAKAEERLHVLGGYAAESEAAAMAASLGLPDRVLGQPRGDPQRAAHVRRGHRARHPRRGRGPSAQPGTGDPAARWGRGHVERRFRRSRRAGLDGDFGSGHIR